MRPVEGETEVEVETETKTEIEVQFRGTEIFKGLKPSHVLSSTSSGVGAILLEAARQGEAALVEMLLDAGVSPVYCDSNATTALIEAARERRADVCRLLINSGMDIHAFNNFRLNAFDVAVKNRDVETLRGVKPSVSDLDVAAEGLLGIVGAL